MAKVYVVCIGEKGSDVGGFATQSAFTDIDNAVRECLHIFNENGGGFKLDLDEAKPRHICNAWSSDDKTIWLEQLELEE